VGALRAAPCLAHRLRTSTYQDAAFIYGLRFAGLREYVPPDLGWDGAIQAARFRAHFEPARYHVVVVAGRDVGAVASKWRPGETTLASSAGLMFSRMEMT
jgi:hypothetical protein